MYYLESSKNWNLQRTNGGQLPNIVKNNDAWKQWMIRINIEMNPRRGPKRCQKGSRMIQNGVKMASTSDQQWHQSDIKNDVRTKTEKERVGIIALGWLVDQEFNKSETH